jgi:lysophospholipase L1-like esterase
MHDMTPRRPFPFYVLLFLCSFAVPAFANNIVCIGDSITAGTYATGYPVYLQQKVSGYTVVNRGIGGEVTSSGLSRMSTEMQTYAPQYALIMEGANDVSQGVTSATVAYNLSQMASIARQHGATPVVSTITPNSRVAGIGSAIPYYNNAIASMASANGITLVDSYSRVVGNWSSLNVDGLHPNAAGSEIIASGFAEVISGSSDSGGGGGCFIATAAFGSYIEPHVMVLRQFRDQILLPHELGKWFVNKYYTYSPPLADFIAAHSWLKAIVRGLLYPLIGFSYALLFHPTMFLCGLLFLLVGIGLAFNRMRARRSLVA